MKKRIIAILVTALLLPVMACGSPQKQEEVKTAETGAVKKETASEPVEQIDTEEVSEAITEEPTEEKEKGPKDEILNADFEDDLFQVDDIIFTPRNKTVMEFLQQFPGDYDFYMSNMSQTDDTFRPERLIETGSMGSIDIFHDDSRILSFEYENLSTDTAELKDCLVTYFNFDPEYSGDIYIAHGIPMTFHGMPQYEPLSYDNYRQTIADWGFETVDYKYNHTNQPAGLKIYEDSSDLWGTFFFTGTNAWEIDDPTNPGTPLEILPQWAFTIHINPDTRMPELNSQYDFLYKVYVDYVDEKVLGPIL